MNLINDMLSNPAESGPVGTVNLINKSTFSQIAHSLSPEPERLLRQQIGVPIEELAKQFIGQKRALNETNINAAEEVTSNKK